MKKSKEVKLKRVVRKSNPKLKKLLEKIRWIDESEQNLVVQ